ncbi:MAG: DUF2147 domain-containing protein [Bacteroidota bacterium]
MSKAFLSLLAMALLAMTLLALPGLAQTAAPTVLGQWRTIDDALNEPRSIVTLYEQDGAVHGRVEEIFFRPGEPDNPTCRECPGDKQGQPIVGLEFMWDFEQDGADTWAGGRILDPENGKVYKAKMKLRDDGRLDVRGFIGISAFGRTQTWERVEDSEPGTDQE